MYKVEIESNSMLALFSGVKVHQPFRHQKLVALLIDFSEYKKFVEMTVNAGREYLYFANPVYSKALNDSSGVMLLRLFYCDVYKVLINEVILSINKELESTFIGATFSGEKSSSVTEIGLDMALSEAKSLSTFEKAKTRVDEELAQSVKVNTTSPRNIKLRNYAYLLRALSLQENPRLVEIRGGLD